ncbi:MAG TPA: hypothetical protein DDY91_19910 [Planctomycetaceae bacterium]|nr:hypothetical protein [Planctomycetaceae bacterium]
MTLLDLPQGWISLRRVSIQTARDAPPGTCPPSLTAHLDVCRIDSCHGFQQNLSAHPTLDGSLHLRPIRRFQSPGFPTGVVHRGSAVWVWFLDSWIDCSIDSRDCNATTARRSDAVTDRVEFLE